MSSQTSSELTSFTQTLGSEAAASGPVPSRPCRFSLREFDPIRACAIHGFYRRGCPDRTEFVRVFPDAAGFSRRLDVADLVLKQVGEEFRNEAGAARLRAAKHRSKRREGGWR